MPSAALLLSVYCVAIVGASLAGGWLPMAVRLTHTRMQVLISAVAGFMLGVAVLHMLPHARSLGADSGYWLLAGLLTMFFVERYFASHHHELPNSDHGHGHAHNHDHTHRHAPTSGRRLHWAGAMVGLALHSLANGVALASAVAAERDVGSEALFAGLSVFLVVAIHKPLDALTVLSLTGNMPRLRRHLVNGTFALCVPLGVVLAVLGLDAAGSETAAAAALAFSAGTFLCISLSDLLPELHFHRHDRGKLSLALLLGVALAWGVSELEHVLHHHH